MDPVIRAAVYNLMDCGYSFIDAVRKAKAEAPRIKKEHSDRAAERASQEALITAWTHPIGTAVWVRRDDGHEEATTTRSMPWMVGSGDAVILLVGISGGYALERVRLRDGVPRPGGLCPECGGCAGVDGSDRCVCTPKGGTA